MFLNLDNREAFYGGSAGGGKDLALASHILTTDGWSTIGDLCVGDFVFDHDGEPTKVVRKSEPRLAKSYEVLMADGEVIVASHSHLWNVTTERQRANYRNTDPRWQAQRRARRPSRARTAEQREALAEAKGDARGTSSGTAVATTRRNSVKATRRREVEVRPSVWDYTETMTTEDVVELQGDERQRVAIPNGAALNTPGEWRSEIPPYTLGAWLGDGSSQAGWICAGVEDAPAMATELEADGWTVRQTLPPGNPSVALLYLSDESGRKLISMLRSEGLLGNKHVPEWIHLAPHADRQAFLGGFCDTDGYVDARRGRVEFCLAREDMVDDVWSLFWSIGERPTKITHRVTRNQDPEFVGDAWRFGISNCSTYLFRMPRKRDRLADQSDDRRSEYRSIASITEIGERQVQCITVDNDSGLFRVGRTHLVTHNSDALLMGALTYMDVPGYSALLLRRSFTDLDQPGALMHRANDWLSRTDAHKQYGGKRWTFPSTASLNFGHVQNYAEATSQFSSAEFQYIGIDELTQGWDERTYLFLLSRIRRPRMNCRGCRRQVEHDPETGEWRHVIASWCDRPSPADIPSAPDGTNLASVPLRLRSASNPGGSGHVWVRDRFVDPGTREPGAVFVPARLEDNPHLDQEAYAENLKLQGGVLAARLLEGNWDITEDRMFKREWFQYSVGAPDGTEWCRYWDLASTHDGGDATAGALLGVHRPSGSWYLADMVVLHERPLSVQNAIVSTATTDSAAAKVPIGIEQEPGSSGKFTTEQFRTLLVGHDFASDRPSGDKAERARGFSSAAEAGRFYIVCEASPDTGRPIPPDWTPHFIDEAETFPGGAHDDQIDAVTGAMKLLTQRAPRRARVTSLAQRRIG